MAPLRLLQDRRGFDPYMKFLLCSMPLALGLMIIYSWKVGLAMLLVSAVCFIALEAISAAPANNPRNFIKKFLPNTLKSCPTMVCLGDSLTHGNCSGSFTPEIPRKLAEKLGMAPPNLSAIFTEPLWVVNAGQNGLTSYTVLEERVEAAMQCHPDYMLIMIGTNDVLAMYKSSWAKSIQSTWSLPRKPSIENFGYNLQAILTDIQEMSVNTTIGVCTLPPVGENLQSEANQWVKKVNVIIEKTVNSCNAKCTIVPIFEQFETILEKKPNKAKALSADYFFPVSVIMCALYHLLPGMVTWNSMSKLFGHLLLSDGVHLNERGRDTVVEVIVDWLLRNNIAKAVAVKLR
eukprot:CAMPEP_0198140110 /NCGR_PEP_ID=MMETSP1443-20131203/3323_1 /TAXON_ID=186043 /ORGANISM="Entomoneis sp., Strain CCMP2396" /LENGTH=346 /DNA_ID=CAMNT_0043802439 /DNA_START=94 /DNA_END=1134 /DNA_ORIENTATION=+